MEASTQKTPARLPQRVLIWFIFFWMTFGVYRLIEYMWADPKAGWWPVIFSAILATIFAAKLPPFRREKLGSAPRS
jgi:uncharacterized membrane protein HdeD (DUF308 family)